MAANSLTIAENERRFIAQELHDHLAQTLLQMNMQVSICRRYLELGYTAETAEELQLLEDQTLKASQQARQLISDLRPPVSEDGSFRGALNTLIAIHHQRGGAPVTLNYLPDTSLPLLSGHRKLGLLRIIQEALLNTRKHAQATQVELTVKQADGRLIVTITDDGVGFDNALVPNPLAEKGGAGMVNMLIRAADLGGELAINSQPGHGATIEVVMPL